MLLLMMIIGNSNSNSNSNSSTSNYSYSHYHLLFCGRILTMISLFRSSISHVCAGGGGWKFHRWQWHNGWRCGMLPDPLRSCLLPLTTLPFFNDDWWLMMMIRTTKAVESITFPLERECGNRINLRRVMSLTWLKCHEHDMKSIECKPKR